MKDKVLFFVLLFSFPLLIISCKNDSGLNSRETVEELCVIRSDGTDLRVIAEGGLYNIFLPDSNKILYTSGITESKGLNIINIDGSGNTPLINNLHTIWGFSVSPDKKKVLMPSHDGIYLMELSNLKITLIFESDGRPVGNANFSRDMTQIVFQNSFDIEMINFTGTGRRTIKKETELIKYICPNFFFDDNQVIYLVQQKKAYSQVNSLGSYSLRTGIDTILIPSDKVPIYFDYFQVSGDNRILAGIGATGSTDTLKVIDPANNYRTISLDAGYNFSFSPDENKVLYVSNGNIYMINADGTNRKLIYSSASNLISMGQPKLSYDGKYIVFGRSRQK